MLSKSLRFAKANRIGLRNFSVWSQLTPAPKDPILGINESFKEDSNPKKQLLGVGAYRTNEGKPYVLECVKKAEQKILDMDMDHEYSGIDGIPSFRQGAVRTAYGSDSEALKSGRIASSQSLSGTGSLRLGFEFLKSFYPNKNAKIYVADPTWPTHKGIAARAGFETETYRYYDRTNRGLDLVGMLEDLEKADDESIFVFHMCAHNPTGCDPSNEDWQKILEVVQRKKHFAAFDNAYQGFASGDLDRDAYSLRLFTDNHDRICLFQSFAKNFGLYGERVGCLSFVCSDASEANTVSSRMKTLARPMYSNPPIHGARVVDIILSDPELTKLWHQDLVLMSSRMADMRTGLVQNLKNAGSVHDWSHITSQIGMFAYTGVSKEQVIELREKHGLYMTEDGRISIAGLNTHNLKYIAESFHDVTKTAGL